MRISGFWRTTNESDTSRVKLMRMRGYAQIASATSAPRANLAVELFDLLLEALVLGLRLRDQRALLRCKKSRRHSAREIGTTFPLRHDDPRCISLSDPITIQ